MFKFTTTTIINGKKAVDLLGNPLLDSAGEELNRFYHYSDNTDSTVGPIEEFVVVGTGRYKKEHIVSAYKRAYSKGVREVHELTVPTVPANTLLKLTAEVKLFGNVEPAYMRNDRLTKEPVTVFIVSSGTPADDATKFKEVLDQLKFDYGNEMFTTKQAGAVLTFTAKRLDQRFDSIILEEVKNPSQCQIAPQEMLVAKSGEKVAGKLGFGDNLHMMRSIMLPSAPNTDPFGILTDERPVLGSNYSQFTLRYKIRTGEDCIWDGDKKAITTHVFYVADCVAADFEAKLAEVFADIEEVADTPANNFESEVDGSVGATP